MSKEEKLELIKIAFEKAELYDSMLREFEHVTLTFEIICSASCFGQLKRHRIATISPQLYDISLGYTLPEPIREIGRTDDFRRVMEHSENVYREISNVVPDAADYALTNAHRRRVLVTLNARELYHFSRLRSDAHAQWEIQGISNQMVHLGRKVMPLTLMLTGGKDSYPKMYANLFGHPPQIIDAELPDQRTIDT